MPFKLFCTEGQTANFATIVSCNFKGSALLDHKAHHVFGASAAQFSGSGV